MDNIKSYKLVTGDEIIAKVDDENDAMLTLSDTRIVGVQQMPGTKQLGVGFMPFMVSNLSDNALVFLRKESIVAEQKPSSEIKAAYVKNTTGIEIATM